MASGYHEVVYDDGDQYKGDWNADGKRDGYGTLSFVDGSKYAGKFANGLCSGLGVLTFPDGSLYEGEFQNGKYHGHGVYKRADGMRFDGQFRDGQAIGAGLLTFQDGSNGRPRQEGEWDGHKLVRKCNSSAAVNKAQECAMTAKSTAMRK